MVCIRIAVESIPWSGLTNWPARAAPRHSRTTATPLLAAITLARVRPRQQALAILHCTTHSHAPARQSPLPSTPCTPPARQIARAVFASHRAHLSSPRLVLATTSRDGPREEEGEGDHGREAGPQADPSRERGQEGRDGGKGRRGAGFRPCSPIPDSRAASQRQRQGQSQRGQGHQGGV